MLCDPDAALLNFQDIDVIFFKNNTAMLCMSRAAGPGQNANEHCLANWDKALQSKFVCSQFVSTS